MKMSTNNKSTFEEIDEAEVSFLSNWHAFTVQQTLSSFKCGYRS